MTSRAWQTISAQDYQLTFDRFGGSFAVHPRVVDLVSALADRPVRYMGLTSGTEIIAAAPLWGETIVATRLALETHGASRLIDVGDAEVALPVARDVRIEMPFAAPMLSSLHVENIGNLEQDACAYPGRETITRLTLAKGLRAGNALQSAKSKKRRRLQIRRFLEFGGAFRPLRDYTADELAAIYRRLYKKRWGEDSFLLGEEHLPTVFRALEDMLFGDLLVFRDRPVAMELVYKHDTPRWLFANGVQAGYDPEFIDHSIGSILLYHNLERLEDEAIAGDRQLRYSLGWSDAPYKDLWAFEQPAYRLRAVHGADAQRTRDETPRRAALSMASLSRLSRPFRKMASLVSFDLRRRTQRAATALSRIAPAGEPQSGDECARLPKEPAASALVVADSSDAAAIRSIIERHRTAVPEEGLHE